MNTSKVSSMFTLSFQLLMAVSKHFSIDDERLHLTGDAFSASKNDALCLESSSKSASGHWFRPFVLIELPDELHPGGTEKLRTLLGASRMRQQTFQQGHWKLLVLLQPRIDYERY